MKYYKVHETQYGKEWTLCGRHISQVMSAEDMNLYGKAPKCQVCCKAKRSIK